MCVCVCVMRLDKEMSGCESRECFGVSRVFVFGYQEVVTVRAIGDEGSISGAEELMILIRWEKKGEKEWEKRKAKLKKPSSDDSNRLKDVNASCYFHHAACHRCRRVLRGVLLFWSEDHRGETAGSHSSICMKFGFFSLCAHIQTKARTQTNHKTAHKVQPDSAVMLYSYLLRRGCLFLWTPLRPGGWVSVEICLFEWQLRAEGETGGGGGEVWDSNQWIHKRLKPAEPQERTHV